MTPTSSLVPHVVVVLLAQPVPSVQTALPKYPQPGIDPVAARLFGTSNKKEGGKRASSPITAEEALLRASVAQGAISLRHQLECY